MEGDDRASDEKVHKKLPEKVNIYKPESSYVQYKFQLIQVKMFPEQLVNLNLEISCIAKHEVIKINYHLSEINNEIILEKYDTIKRERTVTGISGTFPAYLFNPSICYDEVHHAIIVSGGVNSRSQDTNDLYVIDLETMNSGKVSQLGLIRPDGRHSHASTMKYTYLYVFGGNSQLKGLLNDLWVFNFQNFEWTQLFVSHPIEKRHYCSITLKDQELYILGGLDSQNYIKQVCQEWIDDHFIKQLVKVNLKSFLKEGNRYLNGSLVAKFPEKVFIYPDVSMSFHREDIILVTMHHVSMFKEMNYYRMHLTINSDNKKLWIFKRHLCHYLQIPEYPYLIQNCILVVNPHENSNILCSRFQDLYEQDVYLPRMPKLGVDEYMNIEQDRFFSRRGNRQSYVFSPNQLRKDPFKVVKLNKNIYDQMKYILLNSEQFENLVSEVVQSLNEPPIKLQFPLRSVQFAKQPLIASSPYFKQLFAIEPNLLEVDMRINEKTAKMDLKLLKLFYIYIHCQKVVLEDNMSLDSIKTLIELADYYMLDDLLRGCQQYIIDRTTIHQKMLLLKYSLSCRITQLQDSLALKLLQILSGAGMLLTLMNIQGFPQILSKVYKQNTYYLQCKHLKMRDIMKVVLSRVNE